MASYRKRGKTWRAEVVVGTIRESATFPDKGRAVAWATKIEGELRAAARGEIIPRSVRHGLERYRDEVSPTHRGGEWERKRIGKFLGTPDKRWPELPKRPSVPFLHKQLEAVTKAEIGDWRKALMASLAPSSARREYGLLRAIFVAAKEWQYLHASPFDGIAPPPEGKARTQRVSDTQIAAIAGALGYAPGSRPGTSQQFIAAAMLLAVETAMRKGELLTLDQDSRRGGRVLHLDRTKNGDERDIPLSSRAVALLELLPTEGRLFPVHSGTFDSLFRRARDRAAPGIHFHDLRREATTRMAAKVDVLTLAKITGHRDVKVLLQTYYAPNMADVASRLD